MVVVSGFGSGSIDQYFILKLMPDYIQPRSLLALGPNSTLFDPYRIQPSSASQLLAAINLEDKWPRVVPSELGLFLGQFWRTPSFSGKYPVFKISKLLLVWK